MDSKGAGSGSVGGGDAGKRWLASLDPYRRLKEEDPIIPFGEGPIISKWGAISRAARTGYHTSAPVQATACQGSASTTPISLRGRGEIGPTAPNQPQRYGRGRAFPTHQPQR